MAKGYDVVFVSKVPRSGYEHFVLTREHNLPFKTRKEAQREAKFRKKFIVAGTDVKVGEAYRYKIRKVC